MLWSCLQVNESYDTKQEFVILIMNMASLELRPLKSQVLCLARECVVLILKEGCLICRCWSYGIN